MRQAFALLSAFALVTQAADAPHTLRGYSQQSSASELQWEQKFKDVPQPDRLRENMRRLSARPHHVGSPYDKAYVSYCTLSRLCNGEGRLPGFSTALALRNKVFVQRFV